MSAGLVMLYGVLAVLTLTAWRRGGGALEAAARRTVEQFFVLVPRMVCALFAAGFVAQLVPAGAIAAHLGRDAGFGGVLVATLTGLITPAGPAIAFTVALTMAHGGAGTPALVAFVTSWSVFAAHRIFIYEIPLMGLSFLRLRLISCAAAPLLAGLAAMAAGLSTQLPATP